MSSCAPTVRTGTATTPASRVEFDSAINALVRPWQILEPDSAVGYLFTISPVVVPLVGVDEMRRLEAAFRQAAAGPESSPSPYGVVRDSSPSSGEDTDDDGEADLS